MTLSANVIRELLEGLLEDAAPIRVRNKMQRAVPSIVRKMEQKGLTPDSTTLKVLVRDALFRLWRVVIPSGSITDLVRDSLDDKVVAMVEADLSEEERRDLTQIVESTMEAALDVAFN